MRNDMQNSSIMPSVFAYAALKPGVQPLVESALGRRVSRVLPQPATLEGAGNHALNQDADFVPVEALLESYADAEPVCESKLFRTKKALRRFDARDVTDFVMICCLVLKVFRHDYRYIDAAAKYARKTMTASSFQGWRSSGTDLFIATAIVRDGSTLRCLLRNDVHVGRDVSRRVFGNMRFNLSDYKRFLGNTAASRRDDSFDRSYLPRLARQLKIEDSRIMRWTRQSCNWQHLSHRERTTLCMQMLAEIRNRFPMAELRPLIAEFAKFRKYVLEPEDCGSSRKSHELAKKLVLRPIAAAGAGYALGMLAGS